MPHYVVLHHRTAAGMTLPRGVSNHFDWMFDHGQALWTWSTESLGQSSVHTTMKATRLPDHRRGYLSYEGPLTGDRGDVQRVESGDFEILRAEPDHYEFAVFGSRCGVVGFQRTRSVLNGNCDDWSWSFRPVRADAS